MRKHLPSARAAEAGGQGGLPGEGEVVCSGEQKKGHVQEPTDDSCNSKILGLLCSRGTNPLTFHYGWNCIPPNSCVGAPTPDVTIIGHGAYKEAMEA